MKNYFALQEYETSPFFSPYRMLNMFVAAYSYQSKEVCFFTGINFLIWNAG